MPGGAGEAALAGPKGSPARLAGTAATRGWLGAGCTSATAASAKSRSPAGGTIFHATKLPLTTWFLAIHLVATAKNGISPLELGRRLGIEQTHAWAMKQKIMQVMLAREAGKPLQGRVELDDAYLPGRGAQRQARARGRRQDPLR